MDIRECLMHVGVFNMEVTSGNEIILLLSVKMVISSAPTSAFGSVLLEKSSAKLQAAQLKNMTVIWKLFYGSSL